MEEVEEVIQVGIINLSNDKTILHLKQAPLVEEEEVIITLPTIILNFRKKRCKHLAHSFSQDIVNLETHANLDISLHRNMISQSFCN